MPPGAIMRRVRSPRRRSSSLINDNCCNTMRYVTLGRMLALSHPEDPVTSRPSAARFLRLDTSSCVRAYDKRRSLNGEINMHFSRPRLLETRISTRTIWKAPLDLRSIFVPDVPLPLSETTS